VNGCKTLLPQLSNPAVFRATHGDVEQICKAAGMDVSADLAKYSRNADVAARRDLAQWQRVADDSGKLAAKCLDLETTAVGISPAALEAVQPQIDSCMRAADDNREKAIRHGAQIRKPKLSAGCKVGSVLVGCTEADYRALGLMN
jgi:hypothetical protein